LLQEADTLISQFFKKCKTLALTSLSDADLENKVLAFKEDILSHKNPYIKALLDASS